MVFKTCPISNINDTWGLQKNMHIPDWAAMKLDIVRRKIFCLNFSRISSMSIKTFIISVQYFPKSFSKLSAGINCWVESFLCHYCIPPSSFAWTRTRTKSTKSSCATFTPRKIRNGRNWTRTTCPQNKYATITLHSVKLGTVRIELTTTRIWAVHSNHWITYP